jgi:RHS repeat-associated protein
MPGFFNTVVLVAMADDGSLQGDQNTSIGVIEPTNPKGNVTRYVYDDLNRQAREIFDDNTCNVYSYDADNNLRRMVDENGSVIVNVYDGINRLTRKDVTRATSDTPHPAGCFKDSSVTWQVIGTTLRELEYDGLSRMTRSLDNNEPEDAQDDATVTYAYDSLSRLLEEVQNGHAVSSRWMGDNNRVGLVYPNGREIETSFDKADRINTIKDKGALQNIVDYDYIGPGRVLERTYSNGVRLTYLDDQRQRDVGYDGLKRVALHRHLRRDNSLVAGFAYDYDRANNKVFEIKQHDNNRKEDYTYDSIYRLGQFARQGQPEDTWQLDGANNWTSRRQAPNQTNNMNEYASFAGVPQLHDDNGNLIDDGTNRYQYDFANRLRGVVRKTDNALLAVYRYDAHGRRNERIVTNTASFNDRVHYLYDGWQEIEERRANSTQQYVYGVWIDEPLTLDRDANNDGAIDRTFFYHQDEKTYVAALTSAAGVVLDQVTYDAYGRPSETHGSIGNPYLFTGRRYDPEAGMLYYRARYHQPAVGRFIQRDPIGMWVAGINLGNGYAYVGNQPVTWLDPLGLTPNGGYEEFWKWVKRGMESLRIGRGKYYEGRQYIRIGFLSRHLELFQVAGKGASTIRLVPIGKIPVAAQVTGPVMAGAVGIPIGRYVIGPYVTPAITEVISPAPALPKPAERQMCCRSKSERPAPISTETDWAYASCERAERFALKKAEDNCKSWWACTGSCTAGLSCQPYVSVINNEEEIGWTTCTWILTYRCECGCR